MKLLPLVAVRVWDLPTRLFHWVLAVLVVAAFICAKAGGDAMVWHFRCGYAVFALLGFRLAWGLCGGHWSRFSKFIFSPATLFRYVTGKARDNPLLDVGHSPTGALAVFAMLLVLAAQVGTGLVSDDEISNAGPLVHLASGQVINLSTAWHATWGQWTLVGMVALHIAAILYYVLLGRRLISPMIRGDKLLSPGTPASSDGIAPRLLALMLLVGCAAGVAYIVTLAP